MFGSFLLSFYVRTDKLLCRDSYPVSNIESFTPSEVKDDEIVPA